MQTSILFKIPGKPSIRQLVILNEPAVGRSISRTMAAMGATRSACTAANINLAVAAVAAATAFVAAVVEHVPILCAASTVAAVAIFIVTPLIEKGGEV